jgi:hypothetical protein
MSENIEQDKWEARLIKIADLATPLAWAILTVGVLQTIFMRGPEMFSAVQAFIQVQMDWRLAGTSILGFAAQSLNSVYAFVILRAVAELIYLLLDIRDLVEPQGDVDPSEVGA